MAISKFCNIVIKQNVTAHNISFKSKNKNYNFYKFLLQQKYHKIRNMVTVPYR